MTDSRNDLDLLFNPSAVAIVGASDDPDKLGGRPLAMSLKAGFRGIIYPVNNRVETAQGRRAYRSLADLPGSIDLAVLAVPQAAVEAELEAAAAAGARAAIVFASDYAETGAAGLARQQALRELAAAGKMRLLGPNCMGAFDVRSAFYPTFLQAFDHYGGTGWPEPGRIAIVSQSGAIGSHLFVLMRDRGAGLSKFVTTGNQADIDVADCIGYLADDPATDVVAVYFEGVGDGRRLLDALVAARARGKRVVVLKVGSSSVGAAAMRSHTASIAGSDAVYDAILAAGGAWRARSLTELAEIAVAAAGPLPRDRSATVISLSGGGGVILADACEKADFVLSPMPESAERRMREIVPFAATRNPIDPGGPAMTSVSIVERFLRVACEEADTAVTFLFLTHLGHVTRMMEPLTAQLDALRADYPDRLFAVIVLGPIELGKKLRRMGFLVFDEPAAAVATLRALAMFGAPTDASLLPASEAVGKPPEIADWSERGARALLRGAGVAVNPDALVTSAAAAADAVERFGRSCALKLVSPLLPHRATMGGVCLDVAGRAEAEAAFDSLLEAWAAAGLEAAPDGVLVSPMLGNGLEVFIGARNEPGLAAVVTLAQGGVDVESRTGAVTRLAPLDEAGAQAMLAASGLAEAARLRLGAEADLEPVVAALVAVSRLVVAGRQAIETIEINPFIVSACGSAAVDALLAPLGRQEP